MSRALYGQLRRHPTWADARDDVLAVLSGAARVEDRAPGQVFVVEGEPATAIHLLTSGAVRVFYPGRRDRPEVTVKLLAAPAAFGDVACVTRTAYTASVQALVPSTSIAIAGQAYFTAMQRDARACFRQYWDVSRRFAGAVQMERAALASGVLERVVALLLAYAEQAGGLVSLAQDDIAQQVGSNRRSVVRVMEQLYASGGLARRGRRYEVVDRARLLAVATGEVPEMLGTADAAPWAEDR